MQIPNPINDDLWQIKIDNDIYEADLATLKEWIKEGRLQPTDKVKKNNLNWLEAIKVSTLRETFSSLENSEMVKLQDDVLVSQNPTNELKSKIATTVEHKEVLLARCETHPETKPNMFCINCLRGFCSTCLPTTNNSCICPNCQIFCHPYLEVIKQIKKHQDQKEPFGITDLKLALLYPLQEYLSLLFYGAIIGISLLPSIYIILGPIMTIIFVFALTSHVIERAESGNLEPDFYAFDLGEMNKNFSSQLIASVTIFLTCLAPYITLQTIYLVKVKDVWVYLSNAVSIFAPQLTSIALLTICWAIFYYPLALLSVHITKSGFSILNPMVGIKIVLKMKDMYFKSFFMYLVVTLLIGGITLSFFYKIIGGNFYSITDSIIRLIIIGIPILYINLVIGGILGRALYKCQNIDDFSLDEI